MNNRNHRRLLNEAAGGAADGAGAGAGSGQGGAPAGGQGATPPAGSQNSAAPWHESISDEALRTYAAGKGFKDVGEAAKAMQEMETRFAVPADAAEYQLPVPQGETDAFAKQAAGWMKDSGVPVQAARQLATKWNEYAAAQAQAAANAQQQAGEQALSDLQGEWGDKYDANIDLAKKAVRTFGVTPEVVEKLVGKVGDAEVFRLFNRIGAAMSESTLNPGGDGSSAAPPANSDAARAARMFPSMKKS